VALYWALDGKVYASAAYHGDLPML
jgi:hypothetical protein